MMGCPECGEREMALYAGEYYPEDDYQEPDVYECVECGHTEVI